jgi:hypothetical protein
MWSKALGFAIFGTSVLGISLPAVAGNFSFNLEVSAGAATCLKKATGHATIAPHDATDTLHVEVSGLPANTDFDLFIIQVPTAPFGFSWYQGDIITDSSGVGVGTFVGRFSKETTVVDVGSAPAPVVFPTDAASNPPPLSTAAPSIQTYHLGLWFDSPKAAGKAGCATTQTPFNGTHSAGIQVLNTANFPIGKGPLGHVD